MIFRFMLVRRGCHFCHKAERAVNALNTYLPLEKQIQVKDNFEWEELGIKGHPIMDKLDKGFEGYPYIFIDGIEIEPSESETLFIAIGNIVKEDLIMPVKFRGIVIG